MPRRQNQADSSLIIRSRIAALAVAGWSTRRISEDVDLSRHTVRRWIARSELGELRSVRPGRARVTTEAEDDAIRQNANELRFVSNFDPEEDFPVLEKRYAKIEKTRDNFFALQVELEFLDEDLEQLRQYKSDFEETFFKTYKVAHNLLFPKPIRQPHTPTEVAAVNDLTRQPLAPNTNQTNVNAISNEPPSLINDQTMCQPPNYFIDNKSCLPTISLPSFSGSFDSWLGFYDLFNSLVHEDDNITPIKKLFYLKGCLTGEAANVIASIETFSQNYDVTWNLLREHYDDRKLIREKYIQALIDTDLILKTNRKYESDTIVEVVD
ncbi:hypothetical protein FQR65_LT14449 [Abscondita terminalis]|nr:hypothetical protein FQR65_LT14449 [Abscondita terminalis]